MAFLFTLPVIGVTLDPTWSQEFLDNFNKISNHTHTGLSGDADKIDASNLLITTDFSLNGFNLINTRSVILQNLTSDPIGINDVCSIYFKNGNFYINNQVNTHVQITNGSAINVSSTVASVFSYATSGPFNFILTNTATYTYLAVDTSTAKSVFLPSASTVSAGRFLNIKDASGNCQTNPITIVPNAGDTIDNVSANYVVKNNYGSWMVVSNGVDGWYAHNDSTKLLNNGTLQSNGSGVFLVGNSEVVSISSDSNVNLANNGNSFSVLTDHIELSAAALNFTTTGTSLIEGNIIELIADDHFIFLSNSITLGTNTGTTFSFNSSPSTNIVHFNSAVITDGYLAAPSMQLGNLSDFYAGQIQGQIQLRILLKNDSDVTLNQVSQKIIYYTAATATRTVFLDGTAWTAGTYFNICNPTSQTITISSTTLTHSLTTKKWIVIVWGGSGSQWFIVQRGDLP